MMKLCFLDGIIVVLQQCDVCWVILFYGFMYYYSDIVGFSCKNSICMFIVFVGGMAKVVVLVNGVIGFKIMQKNIINYIGIIRFYYLAQDQDIILMGCQIVDKIMFGCVYSFGLKYIVICIQFKKYGIFFINFGLYLKQEIEGVVVLDYLLICFRVFSIQYLNIGLFEVR